MNRSYLKQNVYEAAVARVERLFDEFPEVIVSFSGGKDSTVAFNIARDVAERRGRLPIKVLWIDQEAEWDGVVDYVRDVMNRPDVAPMWFQGPFRLSNSTTTAEDNWLHYWRPGDEWLRPKEPNSIHVNETGCDRFKGLFTALVKHYFPRTRVANVAGVRCEESPARMVGLTARATYKDITWGKVDTASLGHYTFYPLYDWGYWDVWKVIHERGWPYTRVYDEMYRHGVPVTKMRISSFHHETSIESVRLIQEIEPDTWNRISKRVAGINAVSHVRELYEPPRDLPRMFASWREYRDYLLEHLIIDPAKREIFRGQFKRYDALFRVEDPAVEGRLMKVCVAALMVNDYEEVKFGMYKASNAYDKRNAKYVRPGGG